MAEIIQFQEAKDRILGIKSPSICADALDDALEQFSFSRLPERERIARILFGIFSFACPPFDQEACLLIADVLIPYVKDNFTKPYVVPVVV